MQVVSSVKEFIQHIRNTRSAFHLQIKGIRKTLWVGSVFVLASVLILLLLLVLPCDCDGLCVSVTVAFA